MAKMTNYEAEKFIRMYCKTMNEKGKAVKVPFAKEAASKAEIDAVFAKVDPAFVEAWAAWLKVAKKEFKAQTEVADWKEYLAAAKKPGKKVAVELGLPVEVLMV